MAPLFNSIEVGDAPAPLVCGPLTRTQFVRYAGASHDFNPNHHDEVYAQSVQFVQGIVAGSLRGRVARVVETVEQAARDLNLLAALLARIEREPFTASRLRELQSMLETGGEVPSQRAAEDEKLKT